MKKSMKIFSVLMALALVLTLGGCRLWDEAKNSLGPTNKWVRCDFEYQEPGTEYSRTFIIFPKG